MWTTVKGNAISAKPSGTVRKDAGAMIYAGNKASTSRVTTSLEIEMNIHTGNMGNTVVAPNTLATMAATATNDKPVFKPYSAGTFAYTPGYAANSSTGQFETQFLILGYSTKVSNVANTVIALTGAAGYGRKFGKNSIEKFRTLHQSSWDWTTGKAGTATVTLDYSGTSTSYLGVDNAARVTRAAPGNILLLETGKNATSKALPAETD
jgi:hypothetical protein